MKLVMLITVCLFVSACAELPKAKMSRERLKQPLSEYTTPSSQSYYILRHTRKDLGYVPL